MSISTSNNSTGTGVSRERADHEQHLVLSQTPSPTKELCRALREFPGEAGALGVTWNTRKEAETHAIQFCDAACAYDVESSTGEYHARVFELVGGRWGVVVWYA